MANPDFNLKKLSQLGLFFIAITTTSCSFIANTGDSLLNPVSLDPSHHTPVSSTNQQFHQKLFIADLHADTLLWERDLLTRHDRGHVDIRRLIDGNVAIQAFTVFTKIPLPYFRLFSTPWGETYYSEHGPDVATLLAMAQLGDERKRGSLKERALYYAERLQEWADKSNRQFTVIKTKQDLKDYVARRATNQDITAGFLGLEGAHALEGDVGNVQEFFDKGYRMIGLVHFYDNEFGGSSTGDEKGGLKKPGEELIKKLGEKNIIFDLAHASGQTIDYVMDIYEKNPPYDQNPISPLPKIVVSHTGIKGTCDRKGRNLHTQHIKKIAKHGGLIGVGFWTGAMCGQGVEKTVDAVKEVANQVGIKHVALGSDFDGAVETHFDASDMALLTHALTLRGFTEQEIRLIMGENIKKFLLENLPS